MVILDNLIKKLRKLMPNSYAKKTAVEEYDPLKYLEQYFIEQSSFLRCEDY